MDDRKKNIYLDEIGQQQLLSEDEERRLSERALHGDERARQRLVEANLRFVVTIARQYAGQGLPIDDLISEGNIGLVKAASHYDATKGVRFVQYAVAAVRRQIEKALQAESGERRLETTRSGHTLSVDAPLNAKPNVSLLSVLVDGNVPLADELLYNTHVESAVEFALRSLDERESRVVNAFFGIGQDHSTLAEIAEDMNLKRERVRQIRDRAVRRMKKAYKEKMRNDA